MIGVENSLEVEAEKGEDSSATFFLTCCSSRRDLDDSDDDSFKMSLTLFSIRATQKSEAEYRCRYFVLITVTIKLQSGSIAV